MEKKKTKLTISGSSKKTMSNIEIAKTQGKNSVLIQKKSNRYVNRSTFGNKNQKPSFASKPSFGSKPSSFSKKPVFTKPSINTPNDFEKRKLAEQRATKRLKGETPAKGKIGSRRRELKLTISRALNSEDIETKGRSLASLKRAKQKENRDLKKEENKEPLKPVKRDVKIPEVITIRELANRMAEQSSNIIKHLLGMGVTATINHSINADTA